MSVNKHNPTSGVSFVVLLLQLLWQTVFSDGKKVTMMLNQTGKVNDIHFWKKYNHPGKYIR